MSSQPLLLDLCLAGLALCVFLADLWLPIERKRLLAHLTWAGLALVCALSFVVDASGTAFGGAYAADPLALWFKRLFLGGGALCALVAADAVAARFPRRQGEYWTLMLLSLLGMSVLASARELILLVVSFELMSIPLYVLTAFTKEERASSEGAIKLFLVGAASVAVTLYGMSLLYGATGSTMIADVARHVGGSPSPLVLLGLFAMLLGMAFKIGAVPFHMWIPDAYQGAFTPFVAFLSVAPKAAGFAALARVYVEGFGQLGARFVPLILFVSALTIVVGNLLALPQTNVKRLLAYSGVAQIGTMLLGLVTLEEQGLGLLLFYLLAYLFTNVGAFAVVAAVGAASGTDDLSAYKGLAKRHPALALAMLVFLLSLGGIPFVAGFWAKLGVFVAAWNDGHGWLVLLGAVLAVVGVFYYLRVARCIYFDAPEPNAPEIRVGNALRVSLAVSAVAVVLLGIFPGPFVDEAIAAARALLS